MHKDKGKIISKKNISLDDFCNQDNQDNKIKRENGWAPNTC
jgi:hypothetical protein